MTERTCHKLVAWLYWLARGCLAAATTLPITPLLPPHLPRSIQVEAIRDNQECQAFFTVDVYEVKTERAEDAPLKFVSEGKGHIPVRACVVGSGNVFAVEI